MTRGYTDASDSRKRTEFFFTKIVVLNNYRQEYAIFDAFEKNYLQKLHFGDLFGIGHVVCALINNLLSFFCRMNTNLTSDSYYMRLMKLMIN